MLQIIKFWKRSWQILLLTSLLAVTVITSCKSTLGQLKTENVNVNLLLGNPSHATTTLANENNYLILRPQYAVSYNRSKGIPNWTSWQLNQSWLGNNPRPPFTPDPTLPEAWYRVKPNDYNGSGFDRGHMTPAADRNKTPEDSTAVFVMSNIVPQAPDNNQGPWEELESYCRELAKQGKELYIVAGVSGTGGTGKNGYQTTISNSKIAVPASTWKVIVVLDKPGLGLNGVTTSTRVIAVNMPNQQGIKDKSWKSFRTSVDAIESSTGYDFLSNVPPSVQNVIEARVDNQ